MSDDDDDRIWERDDLLQAALDCARRGWHVMPVRDRGQYHTLWVHGDGSSLEKTPASADLDIIKRWWGKWPDAFVGIALEPSGLLVVDLDRHAEGADGIESWAKRAPEDDGARRIAVTPRSGRHLYYANPKGLRSTGASALAPGVDVKGAGGMVFVPPSRGYAWLEEGELLDVPLWLEKAIVKATGKAKVLPTGGGWTECPDGIGNDLYFATALTLRYRGASEQTIGDALLALNEPLMPRDPMPERECRKIAASAMGYELDLKKPPGRRQQPKSQLDGRAKSTVTLKRVPR